MRYISIHAPRVGGDITIINFNVAKIYFNPRPPCGGRLQHMPRGLLVSVISIHAPRVGGDAQRLILPLLALVISIHAPRVGGDFSRGFRHSASARFQSTPPVWGATAQAQRPQGIQHFNPRPPCGGRRQKQLKIQAVLVKNRQFLQISSSNSYPILKNKVASLQIILQNLVRDLGDFLRAYVSHLKHQYIFWVVGCLYSKMLDLVFIAVSQVIKTKTVLFRVHDLTQLCL